MIHFVKQPIPATGTLRRSLRVSPVVWLLGLGACTSVLGIEDLHDGPRPGSGGDESTGGKSSPGAGKSSISGSSETPDGGTNNPQGGSNNPSGGSNETGGGGAANANAGSGADSGDGGMAGGGEGGSGGAPASGTVNGKVIDRWGAPVGNVPVQIGTTQTSTDDNGAFSVPDVPATYEVSLVVLGDGWVYQNLTRRDPTLQVFQGHPSHDAYVKVTSDKAVLDDSVDQLSLAAGMPTGSKEYADIGIDSPVSFYPRWEGGTTSTGTIHGLEWTKDASTKLPTTYKAYDSKTLALADGVDAMVTLSLAPKTITTKAVTGTVTPRVTPIASGSRTNSVFVRFSSGASIQVADHKPTAGVNAFSYNVPTLPDSSITVAAWEGSYNGPLGLVHRDGLSPGANIAGAMAIPAPPGTLTLSGGFTNVDEKTTFSFKASPDNAGTFLVVLNSLDTGSHLYIVTTSQKIVGLPNVVDGAWFLERSSGSAAPAEYEWWVETHGAFATVDDMAGPTGYVDEFGVEYTTPVAIHQQDGTYTYSALYRFSTKNQ